MQFTVSVGSDNGGDGGDDGDEATPPPLPDLFEPGDFATCGDCHCIPAEGESCPEPTPNNDFSGIVPSLKGLELVDDPFVLDCDPYTEEGCDTVPPLEQGEVCAYELMVENEVDECPSQYSLHTTSEQEAIDNGWLITHSGACGACSNHQDLIVRKLFTRMKDVNVESTFYLSFQTIPSSSRFLLTYLSFLLFAFVGLHGELGFDGRRKTVCCDWFGIGTTRLEMLSRAGYDGSMCGNLALQFIVHWRCLSSHLYWVYCHW